MKVNYFLKNVPLDLRIIFKVRDKTVIVIIVAVGLRKEGDKKDIYRLARKMIQLNLVEPFSDT